MNTPTRLHGTGLVADDLYLMAHGDVTGRPLVQPRPLGIGLAGGLLAELMLGGCIGVWRDGAVKAGYAVPDDGLERRVRDQISGEQQPHPVREWLLFLARTAAGDVACRLERSGYLARARGWSTRRSPRWVPVNADWAFAPLARLRPVLDATQPVPIYGAVLAGLAVASGLGFRLAQHLTPGGRSVDDAVGQLPAEVRELIAQVQAAVDSVLLSHRT